MFATDHGSLDIEAGHSLLRRDIDHRTDKTVAGALGGTPHAATLWAQAKPKIGAVGGPAEIEADGVAANVLRPPEPSHPAKHVRGVPTAERVQAKDSPHLSVASTVDPLEVEARVRGLGSGTRLPGEERAFFEPRFGINLAHVRVHTDREAALASEALGARAFTIGSNVVFGSGEYRPGTITGRQLLAHELTHTVQQRNAAGRGLIQRAMKFELQNRQNKIYGWNGGTDVWTLPRKFGAADYIHEGKSGVRLESESHGQVEFETKWERKWSRLAAQLKEAFGTTQMINKPDNDVKIAGKTYKRLPLAIPHLRKAGWKAPKGKSFEDNSEPGHPDRPLRVAESLVVKVGDPRWTAYIQISESIEMKQYRSLMRQYEFNQYDPSEPKVVRGRVVSDQQPSTPTPFTIADKVSSITNSIIARVTKNRPTKFDISNLRGFLELVVHQVIRGQYPADSPIGGPAKFTFAIMSRTHMGSIYTHVLTSDEQRLFDAFVANAQVLLLDELGLSKDSRFFVHGQGGSVNPRVLSWLKELKRGRDSLSSLQSVKGISDAMGAHSVGEERGKEKGLVRFEVRMTAKPEQVASNWEEYGRNQFTAAMTGRPRPTGEGGTGLELGAKSQRAGKHKHP